jgi:hypothetical protein
MSSYNITTNFKNKYGRNPGVTYGGSNHQKYTVQARRKKIVQLFNERPTITQGQIAEYLRVNRSTVSRDLKALSHEVKVQNSEGWLLHRERVLRELTDKMDYCEDRMRNLKKRPQSGSRWMEEWRKLKDMEAKILGLYSPDRLLIRDEQTFDKDQEDASVEAVLQSCQFDIEISPVKSDQKQIEQAS